MLSAKCRSFCLGPSMSIHEWMPEQNGRHVAKDILNVFCWMKIIAFWFSIPWSLFLRSRRKNVWGIASPNDSKCKTLSVQSSDGYFTSAKAQEQLDSLEIFSVLHIIVYPACYMPGFDWSTGSFDMTGSCTHTEPCLDSAKPSASGHNADFKAGYDSVRGVWDTLYAHINCFMDFPVHPVGFWGPDRLSNGDCLAVCLPCY